MKKFFSLIPLVCISIMISASGAFSIGLNSVHTPDGVYVIAVGDNGLIFRSSNSGLTWASYSEQSVNFKTVYSFNNNVWFSGDNGKVYKALKTSSVFSSYDVGTLNTINSLYFVDDNTGFLCGDGGIIYKTINGGLNWLPSNTGVTAIKLNSISFKDALNGIVVGNNGTIYMTINGGLLWTPQASSTTKNLLDAKHFADGIAIAGEWGTLIMKPNATTWTAVDTRINTDIRAVTGSSMNDVHVAGGGGFIRNNKNGNTAFKNFEVNPMLANLVDIFYYDVNRAFAVSSLNNVIIMTTNGGTSWVMPSGATVSYSWQQKPGANGNSLGDNICVHPTDRNTVFTAFSGRVFVSRDRGETWEQLGNQMPSSSRPHSFFVSPLDTNIMLCAVELQGGDIVARTTDYGQTWAAVITDNFSNYGEPLQMDPNDPSVFYFAPDGGGFYKSSNSGETWTEISNNYPFRSPCDLMVTYDASNVIFVADGITSSGLADLFKSTNGGVNWTKIFTNPSSSEIPSMSNTVFDNNIVWFTNWPGSDIYKSTNQGANFSINHSNSFSGWGSDVCKEDPNFVMNGSWSGNGPNTSFTTDGGESWTSVPGLAGAGGVMRLIDRGYIVAQAGNNVYKLNISYSVITAVQENIISTIPRDFNLSQNYPNPFNPSTKINFDLPNAGSVSLKVYNELGKEVETLVNDFKNAGSYEITFDGAALSSGIYFYKLEAAGQVSTKKMLLIK